MQFLKHFFDDDSTIVGLCSLSTKNPEYNSNRMTDDVVHHAFAINKTHYYVYETNVSNNVLLL